MSIEDGQNFDGRNYQEMISAKIQSLGLSPEVAAEHAKKLSEIVVSSAVERLITQKGLDMAGMRSLDQSQKLETLKSHFSDEEINNALTEQAEIELGGYLAAINQG